MHANQYWYVGGLDAWFCETDSDLTAEDLQTYFYQSLLGNGADDAAGTDAYTEPGSVLFRNDSGMYRTSGQLETTAALCGILATPKLLDISLHEVQMPAYTPGLCAALVLDNEDAWDTVLDRAYDGLRHWRDQWCRHAGFQDSLQR